MHACLPIKRLWPGQTKGIVVSFNSLLTAVPADDQIEQLVVTLTDAESDDEADAPELFSRQEHEEKYGKIAQLKTELHNEEVEPYLEQFYDTVTDDVLQIGNISLEAVQVNIMNIIYIFIKISRCLFSYSSCYL